MAEGRFITFEGGEGAGKSTQLQRLGNALSRTGVDVVRSREPGGSPAAEEIRKMLVSGETQRWIPETELLLHTAARVEHVASVVKPALVRGSWVVCDRFHDSTLAYQGYGQGLGTDMVDHLHQLLFGAFQPDLTIIFDLPVDMGLGRTQRRGGDEDRYERMELEFHERLRHGFLEIAKRYPDRCAVFDAAKDEDDVYEDVIACVNARFSLALD